MNKKLPIIWIIIGLFEIYIGISGYVTYSGGGLFPLIIPEQIEIKNILFGVISVWIGIGLFVAPESQVKLIYSMPIWMIFYILTGTIQHLVVWKDFDLVYFLIPDYWFIFMSIFTLKEQEKEHIIDKISFKGFLRSNWIFIFIGGILLNAFIFTLAELIPYDIFKNIYKA